MKTRPISRRLILAALLTLALALSLTGLIISSSRDPILGSWTHPHTFEFITFRPDGTCTLPDGGSDHGTWRAIPGPYYTPNPSLYRIINGQYGIGTGYISPHQLTPEHFQMALAQNAIHRTPASARVRLYQCRFLSDVPPAGAPPTPAPAPGPYEISLPLTLEDEELSMDAFKWHRYQPGNWLTDACDWFRGLLPP